MIIQDDRTQEQKRTHMLAVVGTDTFMSGWGEAEGGKSFAGWAFPDGRENNVLRWVERRGDMKRIRVVVLDDYRPKGKGHTHIYVVDEKHPAWNF